MSTTEKWVIAAILVILCLIVIGKIAENKERETVLNDIRTYTVVKSDDSIETVKANGYDSNAAGDLVFYTLQKSMESKEGYAAGSYLVIDEKGFIKKTKKVYKREDWKEVNENE